jgi:hypothetical protein
MNIAQLIIFVFGICIGIVLGGFKEGCRWRSFADKSHRIESAGKWYRILLHNSYYGLNKDFISRKELNKQIDDILDKEND